MEYVADLGGAWKIEYPINANASYIRITCSIHTSGRSFRIMPILWSLEFNNIKFLVFRDVSTEVTPTNIGGSSFVIYWLLMSSY